MTVTDAVRSKQCDSLQTGLYIVPGEVAAMSAQRSSQQNPSPSVRIVRAAGGCTLVVLIAILCTGCAVAPVRAPTRVEGASASAPAKADTTFIRDGATTREEVLQKLAWMDTGLKNERLFAGRWVSSKWGVFDACVGCTPGTADLNRNWHRQTLLVSFDEKGVVRSHRVVLDKELSRELPLWLAQHSPEPLQLSPPLEIPVEYFFYRPAPATLILDNDGFTYRAEKGNDRSSFRVSPGQIRRMSVDWATRGKGSLDPDPRYLQHTIYFTENTPVGQRLMFRADMPAVVILFKYFAQTRTATSAVHP